jgi:hypothetical protein
MILDLSSNLSNQGTIVTTAKDNQFGTLSTAGFKKPIPYFSSGSFALNDQVIFILVKDTDGNPIALNLKKFLDLPAGPTGKGTVQDIRKRYVHGTDPKPIELTLERENNLGKIESGLCYIASTEKSHYSVDESIKVTSWQAAGSWYHSLARETDLKNLWRITKIREIPDDEASELQLAKVDIVDVDNHSIVKSFFAQLDHPYIPDPTQQIPPIVLQYFTMNSSSAFCSPLK